MKNEKNILFHYILIIFYNKNVDNEAISLPNNILTIRNIVNYFKRKIVNKKENMN